MENKNAFLRLLKPVRKQLQLMLFIRQLQLFLVWLCCWLLGILLLSRFIVIPFLFYYMISGAAALIGVLLYRIWRKRPNFCDAARVYNQFVAEDRVLTAYSFIDKDGLMERLQREDAVKQMKSKEEAVLQRKKDYFDKSKILWSAVLLAGCLLLFILPNENNDLAKKRENDLKLVNQTEKELQEKVKEEKDEEVKKRLQEAKEKVAQSKTAEEALEALAKQMKELELKELKEKEKAEALKDWQDSLHDSGMNRLAELLAQKDLEKIAQELEQLNEQWKELGEKQKEAVQSFTGQEQQLSEEELEKIVKAIEEALQSDARLAELLAAKTALQSSGQALQKQMAASGNPASNLAFSSGDSGKPSGNQHDKSGQSGSDSGNNSEGNGSSESNQSSSGAGNGTGTGSGSGSGTGSGSGSGTGSGGSGNGSGSGGGGGAGTGDGSREFLTIPEKTAGKENREVDGGELGEGTAAEQSEGNGPVLKGNIRPYEEVYGEYEASYRESSERYKLPDNLQKIVQNYFTNIAPNGE